MSKLYTINQVCQLTAVSVRTLHYYDEISLLKSCHRSKTGHRLYSEKKLAKLQQIVTLKYIGFSLSKIKIILQNNKVDLLSSLKMQANALDNEERKIKKAKKLLNYLINQHELKEPINWEIVINLIHTFQYKDSEIAKWYDNYLTETELKTFKKFSKKRTQTWNDLFYAIKKIMHTDPGSRKAKQLVADWIKLANDAYQDHPELRGKLWEAYKAGIIPDIPYDKDVIRYLSKFIKAGKL